MGYKSVPLSAIDHVFTGEGAYPIQFVIAYRKLEYAKLKASLPKVLESFYPLLGTLSRKGENSLEVIPAFSPSDLIEEGELSSDVSPSDLGEYTKLSPVIDVKLGGKLLQIKVWQSPNFIYLAIGSAHCITDGYSFFYFLNSWAAATRGESFPQPSHERQILFSDEEASRSDVESHFEEKTGFLVRGQRSPLSTVKFEWTIDRFSKQELLKLRTDWSEKLQISLSDNDVICGTTIKSKLQRMKGNQFSFPVDYRRIHEKLPPNYFGNVVMVKSIRWTEEELKSNSAMDYAKSVRSALRRIKRSDIGDQLSYLDGYRNQIGLKKMDHIHVCDPQNGFLVTNLSLVPLKAINFGTGAPEYIRSAIPNPRVAAVLPNDDGVELHSGK